MSNSPESTPDLSRVVGIIMEHPELIEQISKLVSNDEKEVSADVSDKNELPPPEKAEFTASIPNATGQKRNRLLYALKPYLSERRSKAIDSMMTFGEIFDMMKGKSR